MLSRVKAIKKKTIIKKRIVCTERYITGTKLGAIIATKKAMIQIAILNF